MLMFELGSTYSYSHQTQEHSLSSVTYRDFMYLKATTRSPLSLFFPKLKIPIPLPFSHKPHFLICILV